MSVSHMRVGLLVETTELTTKQLALDCSLGTLVYGHQTWNISLGDLPHRGLLK